MTLNCKEIPAQYADDGTCPNEWPMDGKSCDMCGFGIGWCLEAGWNTPFAVPCRPGQVCAYVCEDCAMDLEGLEVGDELRLRCRPEDAHRIVELDSEGVTTMERAPTTVRRTWANVAATMWTDAFEGVAF